MKKKTIFVCAALSLLLLTGCGKKNYKTVDEYKSAMDAVKNLKTSYTLEVRQTMEGEFNTELYDKTFIKGKKWKSERSFNGGNSYYQTQIYNENDLLQYSANTKFAVKNPALDMMKGEDEDSLIGTFTMLAPALQLVYWDKNSFDFGSDTTAAFVNNKANMNGYDCRLIKFGELAEACVSDELGIAVYYKTSVSDEKGSQTITLNLAKVSFNDVSDSEFELPEGIKLMDFDGLMNNLSNSLKQLSSMSE